jgi:hypothetical protein
MQPLRLVIVATAMVAVLALIAGFAAENERLDRDGQETVQNVAPAPAPSRVVEADVPRKKAIAARVGQSVQLTVTLPEDDTLVIDAFGLDETVAANIPTPILFTAISPGRYDLKLQNSGKVIGELLVRPARPTAEDDDAAPEQQSPGVAEPATAA